MAEKIYLGRRLKQARLARNRMKQQELASLVPGATQASISALEQRNSRTSELLFGLADALKINPRWLLTGQGDSWLDHPGAVDQAQSIDIPPRIEILIARLMAIPSEHRDEIVEGFLREAGAAIDANLVSQRKVKTKLKIIGNHRIEKEFGLPSKMKKRAKKAPPPGRPPDAQLDDIPED